MWSTKDGFNFFSLYKRLDLQGTETSPLGEDEDDDELRSCLNLRHKVLA
jgi:hypothetical protein